MKLQVGTRVRIKNDKLNYHHSADKIKTITEILPKFGNQEAFALDGDSGIWCMEDFAEINPTAKKILVLGHARHGKDALANLICKYTGLKSKSSSIAALEIFLFDLLKTKYNLSYSSIQEAYEDRGSQRDRWYKEICNYNKDDKTRLVKDILKTNDIYIGLRAKEEVEAAIKDNMFDLIFGVYDYRKPLESKKSNTADVFQYSDFIITTNGTLEELEEKVKRLIPMIK